MKHFLILFFAIGVSVSYAQTSPATPQAEQYKSELREKLQLDYSMPDFSTSKLDPEIIGNRLCKMLRKLQDNIQDPVFNRKLSYIVCEQNPNLKYVTIDKFSIKNISKSGNVITIKAKTKFDKMTVGVKTAEIVMSFDDGVSNSQTINDLFSDLGRYAKE